jgi:trehalose 6-phosphate phosphatase
MRNEEVPLDLEPQSTALFLDCDGTLAPIVDHPADARVPEPVLADVAALHELSGGALAIVSGRSIEQLDALFHPHVLPVSGIHGIERRDAEGNLHRPELDDGAISILHAHLAAFVAVNEGLVLETKSASIALHWRMRPDLEEQCKDLALVLAGAYPQFHLQHGKAVAELRLGKGGKGSAILEFLGEPPFARRTPVFAGDDVTDEDGFAAIAPLAGLSIRIGPGDTLARHRCPSPEAFYAWLRRLRRRWEAGRGAGAAAYAGADGKPRNHQGKGSP